MSRTRQQLSCIGGLVIALPLVHVFPLNSKMYFAIQSFILFLTLSFASHCLAKVKVEIIDANLKVASIKIIERIEYEEELSFVEEHKKLIDSGYSLKLNAVVLDTAGGNTSAAMRIGSYIRKHQLNTYVHSNANCASACIYVLIGGVVRMAYGRVAVHRSTYTDEYPTERLEKALRDADNRTVTYVQEMGISSLLTDAILNTPSWATRQLDDKDRRRWGVHGTDRVYEELWFRKTAKETILTLDQVINEFDKHVDSCKTSPMKFQMTMWECVKSKIRRPA